MPRVYLDWLNAEQRSAQKSEAAISERGIQDCNDNHVVSTWYQDIGLW